MREDAGFSQRGEKVLYLFKLIQGLFFILLGAVHKRNVPARLVFMNVVQALEDPGGTLDKHNKLSFCHVLRIAQNHSVEWRCVLFSHTEEHTDNCTFVDHDKPNRDERNCKDSKVNNILRADDDIPHKRHYAGHKPDKKNSSRCKDSAFEVRPGDLENTVPDRVQHHDTEEGKGVDPGKG